MNRRNYMSHQNPEGEGPGERARRHGYNAWGAENVAKGQTSAAQVMDAWMNSEGHRNNILNCGLVAIGVGESGNAWTQLFGWDVDGPSGGPYICRLRGRDAAFIGQYGPDDDGMYLYQVVDGAFRYLGTEPRSDG
jgi:hypothetical protein